MKTLIDDIHDERLRPYANLRHRDDADGYVAEGHFVVQRLITMGCSLQSLLVQSGADAPYLNQVPRSVPIYEASKSITSELVGYPFHRGVLAHGVVPARWSIEKWVKEVRSETLCLALIGISDAENVGSLMRSAAALGVEDILIGPGTISPYVRRAIRVSMAATLTHRFIELNAPTSQLQTLQQHGVVTIATTLDDDAIIWNQASWPPDPRPKVLLLGNEATGLPREIQAACNHRVRLPMRDGTDSLNVAVAGAIFMHDWMRWTTDA